MSCIEINAGEDLVGKVRQPRFEAPDGIGWGQQGQRPFRRRLHVPATDLDSGADAGNADGAQPVHHERVRVLAGKPVQVPEMIEERGHIAERREAAPIDTEEDGE